MTDTRWCRDNDPDSEGYYHIWPLDDKKEHITEGTKCWCSPLIDEPEKLVNHNRTQ